MALSISSNSPSQTATQSPQADVQSINSGTQTSSLQPEPATSLLNGQGGLTLSNANPVLPSVSLSGGASPGTTASQTTAKPAVTHHINAALFALPVLLVVVAGVMILAINRSEKKRRLA